MSVFRVIWTCARHVRILVAGAPEQIVSNVWTKWNCAIDAEVQTLYRPIRVVPENIKTSKH